MTRRDERASVTLGIKAREFPSGRDFAALPARLSCRNKAASMSNITSNAAMDLLRKIGPQA